MLKKLSHHLRPDH